MAKPVQVLRVVIAGPADVKAESDSVPSILDDLNKSIAADRNLRLEPVFWETDAYPGFHVDGPQGLIDPLLRIQDSDVLIGVFWNRFGTPSQDTDSGTEHEIRQAYASWKACQRPQIMVYFNQKASNLRTTSEVEQKARVVQFFERFPAEGLWHPYKGVDAFKKQLRIHLTNWIRDQFPLYPSFRPSIEPGIEQHGQGNLGHANPPHLIISETATSISDQIPSSIVASNPVIRWRPLPPPDNMDLFQLLDWRVRATPLIGREDDLQQLISWTNSKAGILVRFLVGPGGAGKTRLAFEAADKLRAEGWVAGQVFLDQPSALPIKDKGLFLVIDYPEACRAQVKTLLRGLTRIEQSPGAIRILLLSRYPMKEWHSLIDAADAAGICDAQELRIGPLASSAGLQLFRAAAERFAAHNHQPPPDIADEKVADWLAKSDIQSLPIFIVAAALRCVMDRTVELDLTGEQVVKALVRREIMRLDNAGREAQWGEHAASRVVGLAAASDGLDASAIGRLASDADFGLPSLRPVEALKSLHLWHNNRVPPPAPDLVAAELLFEILSDASEKAPEWLWASLADSAPSNVPGLGRVAFDIARLHGPEELVRFAHWLAGSIAGQLSRAERWRTIFENDTPIAVTPLAVAIGRCLLQDGITKPLNRARVLTKLSQRLGDTGNLTEALQCSQEAAEIFARLADEDAIRYPPDLARSLTTLATCLRACNRPQAAAEVAEKAVAIWRELSAQDTAIYEADTARSLKVLSDSLSDAGERDGATESIRSAVEIWQRLAASNPRPYEPELARALNSLSVDLWQREDRQGSTDAIRKSVEIWQRLSEEHPGNYEPELALGLNNLSRNLNASDPAGALKALRSAIRIYGTVVAANPARYGLRLAQSLENLYKDLKTTGDARSCIQALRESVEIKRKLAASNPFQFGPGVAEKLERLSLELSSAKDDVDVSNLLQMIDTAEQTVLILLVRGENPKGGRIFAYVAVRGDKFEEFMAAQKSGLFYPEDFGNIVESGSGEPSPEVRAKMEVEYGFNHEAMIDIPDIEKASEILHYLKPPS